MIVLESLTGTIDDSQPPSDVTVSSPAADPITRNRAIAVGWAVTDLASGPADVIATINDVRQPVPLRAAPPADTTLLTGQRSRGAPQIAGNGTITLPDVDGSYDLRVVGTDTAGNASTSPTSIHVLLDRAAPSVAVTGPGGWRATNCSATVSIVDSVSGIASIKLLDELGRALAYPKIAARIQPDEAAAFVLLLRRGVTLVAGPDDSPARSEDPADDYLLAVAEHARAVLVSGDRHLRELAATYPVHSPRTFLDLLD